MVTHPVLNGFVDPIYKWFMHIETSTGETISSSFSVIRRIMQTLCSKLASKWFINHFDSCRFMQIQLHTYRLSLNLKAFFFIGPKSLSCHFCARRNTVEILGVQREWDSNLKWFENQAKLLSQMQLNIWKRFLYLHTVIWALGQTVFPKDFNARMFS